MAYLLDTPPALIMTNSRVLACFSRHNALEIWHKHRAEVPTDFPPRYIEAEEGDLVR